MKRTLTYKFIFIIIVVLACLLAITGIPKGLGARAWMDSIKSNIHLGLDLQGGTHLILQVNVDDAVRAEIQQGAERLRADLTSKGIAFTSIAQPDPTGQPQRLDVTGVNQARAGDFHTAIQDDLGPNYDINSTGPGNYQIDMNAATIASVKQKALTQSIETISNRVNLLGVTEPTVQAHGLGA